MYWLVHELRSQNSLGSQARVFSWTDRCVWAKNDQINAYQANSPGGEGVLPYMGYIGMCRCEGYGSKIQLN